ncbi:MAG: response regulator [Nostocaceae cyanobacterium]|nr:response regulator [Nostocaceae cyanobacterium]
MNKGTIVCVDDERLVLVSLRNQLTRLVGNEYSIQLAESPEEALAIFADLQREQIDIPLVICDQIMPKMRGDELLIKLHVHYPNTRKVLLTGQAGMDAVVNAVNRANLYRYIAKPWEEKDLNLTVKEAIHSYFQDKQLTEQNATLQRVNQELKDLNASLEQRVAERTSEVMEANKHLLEAKAAAEAANCAKSAFLANMSHELRTPLNAILGFTQIISYDTSVELEHRQYLDIINRSGQHLLKLINDVLEISRIEAGRTKLKETSFDLYRLLDDLQEIMRLKAREKNLVLSLELASQVPQYITTDEAKLRQVLVNLLGNAIKFTQQGRVRLRVTAIKNYQLLFEVEDTGQGISAEEMNSLFKPFGQAEMSIKSHEGTGLGLAISRKFVNLMGGDITVDSVVGQGSRFKFNIQVRLAAAVDLPTQAPKRRVIGLAPDQPTYRLLVVEDHWENSLLLVKLLSSLGFEVQEAKNGCEAIALWESWNPHLILMDMRLPVMNGYEATELIKATAKGQGTVIIAVTSSAFFENRTEILSIGCDDFVSKPFQLEVILAKLAEHLGVLYIYEDSTERSQPQSESYCLTPDSLKVMPNEWIAQLNRSATICRDDEILQLIQQIPQGHTDLAKALDDLNYNFRFEEIMNLSASAKG